MHVKTRFVLKDFYFNEIGSFSLQKFLSRYLGGGCCLEESRTVTRYMLGLSACNDSYSSPYATALNIQINKYSEAVKLLNKSQSLDSLKTANKLLTHNASGSFRTVDSWIGPSQKRAIYVPPPASELDRHLALLNTYIKESTESKAVKAINSSCTLLQIHPFEDGNGRVARALYEGMSHENNISCIAFSLYRFAVPQKKYINFLQSVDIGFFNYHETEFYIEAMEWISMFKKEFYEILNFYRKKIESKILLYQLTPQDLDVILLLWSTPVLDESTIRKTGIESSSFNKLFELGLIDIQTLTDKKSPIYISKDILDFWNNVDNIITRINKIK